MAILLFFALRNKFCTRVKVNQESRSCILFHSEVGWGSTRLQEKQVLSNGQNQTAAGRKLKKIYILFAYVKKK